MRNKLFVDIVSNIGTNIQDSSSSMQTNIKNYVNNIYFELLDEINFKSIDDDYSFSTIAGTKDYDLPSNFSKELYVYDATNLKDYPFIAFEKLAEDFSSTLSSQGTIGRYTIIDKQVSKQPTSASVLSIVSSSSSDSTQVVHIRGISNSVEMSEDVTLTGTTATVTTNSFSSIYAISKSATTTGKITITSNSGAITNAILAPAIKDYKIKVIRFHETPNAAYTIKMPYILRPAPLVSDYDTPVIDCSNVLEEGGTWKAWLYKRQFAKAREYERIYEKTLKRFTWNAFNNPNRVDEINYTAYSRDTI